VRLSGNVETVSCGKKKEGLQECIGWFLEMLDQKIMRGFKLGT